MWNRGSRLVPLLIRSTTVVGRSVRFPCSYTTNRAFCSKFRSKNTSQQHTNDSPVLEEETLYKHNKRSTVTVYSIFGIIQFVCGMVITNIYFTVQRLKHEYGRIEEIKDALAELASEPELRQAQVLHKQQLEQELKEERKKIGFVQVFQSYKFIDWVYTLTPALLSSAFLLIIRFHCARLVNRIDLLYSSNQVRVWTYGGILGRSSVPHTVKVSDIPKMDRVPQAADAMFGVKLPGNKWKFLVDQRDAVITDREKLMRAISGRGIKSSSVADSLARLEQDFKIKF